MKKTGHCAMRQVSFEKNMLKIEHGQCQDFSHNLPQYKNRWTKMFWKMRKISVKYKKSDERMKRFSNVSPISTAPDEKDFEKLSAPHLFVETVFLS
ncbi:hypothetical protein HV410_13895 [Enterococcus faecium]|nr:hypothetical protein [Enterococcus faecium]